MKSLILFFLRAYKLTISPLLGQHCRFYPSCSNYAEVAIRRYGLIKGSVLVGRRLCKCHPWHAGGVDPVPDIDSDEKCNQHGKTRLELRARKIEPQFPPQLSPKVAAQVAARRRVVAKGPE